MALNNIPNNYNILATDATINGQGPYTVTVLQNPTTAASGGTAITPDIGSTNALGTFNIQELIYSAARAIGDSIAAINQSDALN